ncbi:serine hydrolase domain-containing protein [Streptomyces niveus]|uniref:Serine hydrolase n=1 Tax=Streptomyces niveus TaxID=193462 RepID=A0A1U9QUN8_STRNV|nr:serine hydrolase domain-containing protein [Streptomyces niveus]AQU67365.1 serine hydrolase [Streptomyces niveus]
MSTQSKTSRRPRLPVVTALVTAAVCAVSLGVSAGPAPAHGGGPGGRDSAGDPLSQRQLQREVDRTLKKAGYIAVSVQVRDGQRRTYAVGGEAELGTGRPVSHAAGFRAASVTKTFVSTVVLQLVAEGRLSLDDTVEEWLPGLVTGNGNDGSRITVRHLLQHTSGLYNYDFTEDTGDTAADFERTRFDHYEPEEAVAGALKHKPDFEPADPNDPDPDWNYSNTGYIVAGMIIEKVTGRSWDREVRDRIVRPLGLTQTYAPGDDPGLKGPYTHSYQQFPGSTGWTDTSIRNVSWATAAGELITGERDLDRFLTALQRGRLLPPAQMAELRRTVPAGADFQQIFPGLHYGLGVMRQPLSCGGYRWGHGGDLEGQTVRTAVSADGQRTVVLNATGKKADDESLFRAEGAVQALLDRAICGGGDR